MIGIFKSYDESVTGQKPFWFYTFDLLAYDLLKSAKLFIVKTETHIVCAMTSYYGPVVNVEYNGQIGPNPTTFVSDFVTIPFNDILLEDYSIGSEALKTRQFKKNKNEYPSISININKSKLHSLALLLGVYDTFFPNVLPYKHIDFQIKWNGKEISLGLGWLHCFLTEPALRTINNENNAFLNQLVDTYYIQPVFITPAPEYKNNPFIVSVSTEPFLVSNLNPDSYFISTRAQEYYKEYDSTEFNENEFANYPEILEEPKYDFQFEIISITVPKSLKGLIFRKLSCFIAFHYYHQEKDKHDHIENLYQEIREKERMDNLDIEREDWGKDPFDETPGWHWNID